jgi:hypothetical protein
VEFADNDIVCETLEGLVHFPVGDAILTEIRGERWPCKATCSRPIISRAAERSRRQC